MTGISFFFFFFLRAPNNTYITYDQRAHCSIIYLFFLQFRLTFVTTKLANFINHIQPKANGANLMDERRVHCTAGIYAGRLCASSKSEDLRLIKLWCESRRFFS